MMVHVLAHLQALGGTGGEVFVNQRLYLSSHSAPPPFLGQPRRSEGVPYLPVIALTHQQSRGTPGHSLPEDLRHSRTILGL